MRDKARRLAAQDMHQALDVIRRIRESTGTMSEEPATFDDATELKRCLGLLHKCAMALPPSDFGSDRALHAAARVMLAYGTLREGEGREAALRLLCKNTHSRATDLMASNWDLERELERATRPCA